MDKETRNAIERATQKARRLLEQDFAEQLDGVFDVRPDGRVAGKGGAHLTGRQQLQRDKIVAAIEHKRNAGMKPEEAVADYVRDAAFTALNRFAALKMLEARDLVQECVSRGDNSTGFIEFCGLAPALKTADGAGYRLYIESIFDELSTEVKVLFDRRDSASVLWPTKLAFDDLLAILNHADLADVWPEDETIGWIYQFFNSDEERRQMRVASQAPRNTRELAIRNQFFTPRYVVEFLTDNTLGRLWDEMRKGDTTLAQVCKYMIRRPGETFVDESGYDLPDAIPDDLTQDELWQRQIRLPHRPQKDPRDIRILDPACGSGHFLLYCFVLLLTIYEEAWSDAKSPASEATGRTLRQDFATLEDLRRALPGLILRHNLHGVDIDARCAQIAQLALWMRAQRAYRDFGIPRSERPVIRRVNIVIAEPMPGEKELLTDFLGWLKEDRLEVLLRRTLEIPLGQRVTATKAMADSLANLVTTVWDGMKLAGEMGTLLKLEQDLARAVEKGRSEWDDRLPLFRVAEYGIGEHAKGKLPEVVSGPQQDFWTKAESLVLQALAECADEASNLGAARSQLFVEDTTQGFAFADQLFRRYDVVLMNPPFGDPPVNGKKYTFANYGNAKTELYAAFIDRALELAPSGLVGCLASRTGFFLTSLERWRRESLLGEQRGATLFLDLGEGVLDAAVECACVVIGRSTSEVLCGEASGASREDDLKEIQQAQGQSSPPRGWRCMPRAGLAKLPGATFAYRLPTSLVSLYAGLPTLAQRGFVAKQGIGTSDNFRFLRLRWEVPCSGPKGWLRYSKGGGFSPYFSDSDLLLNWEDDGAEVKAYSAHLYGSWSKQITNTQFFGKPGLTYSSRTHREFAPAIQPVPSAFDTKGCCIFAEGDVAERTWCILMGMTNSRIFGGLLRVGLARASAGLARQYNESLVMAMPVPELTVQPELDDRVREAHRLHHVIESTHETSSSFDSVPWLQVMHEENPVSAIADLHRALRNDWERQIPCAVAVDRAALAAYYPAQGAPKEVIDYLDSEIGQIPVAISDTRKSGFWDPIRSSQFFEGNEDTEEEQRRVAHAVLSAAFGVVAGRWPAVTAGSQPAAMGDDLLTYSTNGVVGVDDKGHPADVVMRLQELCVAPDGVDRIAAYGSELGANDLRAYLRYEFFPTHVQVYSANKRKAPIYWQIATTSGRYAVWLYIHKLTSNTLYVVQNDCIAPKLAHEQRQLDQLRVEAGPNGARGKEIEEQELFVQELKTLLEDVNRVAPLWNPDLKDGVIINFAPLWRLVSQNRTWQKELRSTWDAIVAGRYDWSHLSMRLWPERVLPKCAVDRSVAVAHGLEKVFWYEDENGKWRPYDKPKTSIPDLIRQRTSPTVKAALKAVIEAPDVTSGHKRTRKSAA
ncbi:BREX-1 system adenine-specific DNA-methyltransferase PglX [Bradyrhizobium sp. 62]|uniref:BREX-1 system adenine-specific DNA-methyltransferase PglX n=1 Tax=Bradyrhizobium sp. 62 TaxID=1043588 RepID=UPI001FF70E4F|nr:BREX-1 system adenine-specific DNA-methyltransferase PglX [Bradyrhizobium sp. 62]MCK1365186.1 BREX-1 system adenine-specific DNA-methyltransferase PglX [Bradyrhizobium sp. 62]